MSNIEIRIEITGGETFPMILELFDSTSIHAGMTKEIPGGATLTLGPMPLEKRSHDVGAMVLSVVLSVPGGLAANAISNWLRDKMAKRPSLRILIEKREFHFEDGELKKLIETKAEIQRTER